MLLNQQEQRSIVALYAVRTQKDHGTLFLSMRILPEIFILLRVLMHSEAFHLYQGLLSTSQSRWP